MLTIKSTGDDAWDTDNRLLWALSDYEVLLDDGDTIHHVRLKNPLPQESAVMAAPINSNGRRDDDRKYPITDDTVIEVL